MLKALTNGVPINLNYLLTIGKMSKEGMDVYLDAHWSPYPSNRHDAHSFVVNIPH